MKYRKYDFFKTGALIFLSLGLAACAAGTANTKAGQNPSAADVARAEAEHAYDGREPASMKGDIPWLTEVGDDFGRIADETSRREVASDSSREVLMKQKDWTFSFLPKTNHFYVELQGSSFKMEQTRINDGERFAFAAEGQAENPLTFAVSKAEGRDVASEGPDATCDTDISYWDKHSKAYVTNRISVKGKACERMLSLLKDYVP